MPTSPNTNASTWLARLAVLPIVLLALPFGVWLPSFDPEPSTTATALVALSLVPAAIALWRHGLARPLTAVALVLPIVVAAWGSAASDQFEVRRATLQAVVLALGFVIGAALDTRGRVALGRALIAAALVHLVPALLGAVFGDVDALAGRLGNVGPTNQLALGGAVLGAWSWARERGPWRWIGASAALCFVLHAATAPVLAGLLTLALVLIAGAVFAPWPAHVHGRGAQLTAAGLLLGTLVLVAALPHGARVDESSTNTVAEAVAAPDHTGGLSVRLDVWSTLPHMIANGGALGRGPGQFAAAYPPFRSSREMQVSGSHTEVEHPHNDWLLLLVEYGWLGGLGATFVLAGALVAAWRQFRRRDEESGAFGAAVIALALAACAHSVLLGNPAGGLVAALSVGAVLADSSALGVRAPTRLPGLLALVLALVACVPAWSLARHGAALARATHEWSKGAGTTKDSAGAVPLLDALGDALEFAPHSPIANDLLRSRALAFVGAGVETERWLAIAANANDARLHARPLSPGCYVDRGLIALLGKAPEEARKAWETALVIAPDHPAALTNLARLELTRGEPRVAVRHLDRLFELGVLDGNGRRDLVRWALQSGATPEAAAIALGLDPAEPSAIFEEGRARTDELAQALAHHLWAHQFLDHGDVEGAARSMRQAARSYAADGTTSALGTVELAGAEWLVGRADAARRALESLAARDWSAPELAVHHALVDAIREAAR